MISAEAPVLFAKACELFILEITHRSWQNTSECKRRTLQRNDVATSIAQTDIFDFLVDIVPREEQKPAVAMVPKPGGAAPAPAPAGANVATPNVAFTQLTPEQQQQYIQAFAAQQAAQQEGAGGAQQ